MNPMKYTCPKCGNNHYESGEMRATGSFLGKIFDIQSRKFTTVTCTNCKYTEFFASSSSQLGNVLDFFTS